MIGHAHFGLEAPPTFRIFAKWCISGQHDRGGEDGPDEDLGEVIVFLVFEMDFCKVVNKYIYYSRGERTGGKDKVLGLYRVRS